MKEPDAETSLKDYKPTIVTEEDDEVKQSTLSLAFGALIAEHAYKAM